MPLGHCRKGFIAFGLCGIPVQAFPVVTEHIAQCVAGRQRNANAKTAVLDGFFGFDEIVRVIEIHVLGPLLFGGRSIPNVVAMSQRLASDALDLSRLPDPPSPAALTVRLNTRDGVDGFARMRRSRAVRLCAQ